MWNKKLSRTHEKTQFWVVSPVPSSPDDYQLMEDWERNYNEKGTVPDTFYDLADPFLNKQMEGSRGIKWDYLPFNEWEQRLNEIVYWPTFIGKLHHGADRKS